MNEEADILFVLSMSALGMIFVVLLSWIRRYFNAKRKKEIQETIRLAIQQGQVLTPELVRAMAFQEDSYLNDLRWGVILIAAAFGIGFMGTVSQFLPDTDGVSWLLLGFSAFPFCIGCAFLFLHASKRKADN